jgi:hypothetical protein
MFSFFFEYLTMTNKFYVVVVTFGLLPSVVFLWFVTNVSGLYIRPIFRVHWEPEKLVKNQRKTTPGNNPKVITTYCNPGGNLKSQILRYFCIRKLVTGSKKWSLFLKLEWSLRRSIHSLRIPSIARFLRLPLLPILGHINAVPYITPHF